MSSPDDAIRTVATTPVVWARPEDSLRVMAARMRDAHGGALVVRRRDGAIGIVTERDVLLAVADGGHPDAEWATDVMSRVVLTASPDDPVLNVAELMADAEVRHVVLVEPHGSATGVVSVRDVLRPLLEEAYAARRATGPT